MTTVLLPARMHLALHSPPMNWSQWLYWLVRHCSIRLRKPASEELVVHFEWHCRCCYCWECWGCCSHCYYCYCCCLVDNNDHPCHPVPQQHCCFRVDDCDRRDLVQPRRRHQVHGLDHVLHGNLHHPRIHMGSASDQLDLLGSSWVSS